MRKYQEPEMEIMRFKSTSVVTESPGTLYPSTTEDGNGSSVGGGTGESGGWGDL